MSLSTSQEVILPFKLVIFNIFLYYFIYSHGILWCFSDLLLLPPPETFIAFCYKDYDYTFPLWMDIKQKLGRGAVAGPAEIFIFRWHFEAVTPHPVKRLCSIIMEIINRGLLFSLQNINLRRHHENNQASHKINTAKEGWKAECIKCTSLTPNKCGSCAKLFSAGAEESCQVFARCGPHTSVAHGNQEE